MVKIFKLFRILVALALFLGMLGATAPGFTGDYVKAQPQLVQAAQRDPAQSVRVIVQRLKAGDGLETRLVSLGGKIVLDLSIINAFAAELPAQAALRLSRDPRVRWVSLDAPMVNSGKPGPTTATTATVAPANTYLDTLGVRNVWKMGLSGEGIAVALIDSGLHVDRDFSTEVGKPFTRVLMQLNFNDAVKSSSDEFGHGTHVAGIIGGNGGDSPNLQYAGTAPKVNLINLKVNDDELGMCYESAVVAAMQWVYNNRSAYNIRVVNLSLNSSVESSYHTSPMDAAAEILWFNGIVVIASAGNSGTALNYNPVRGAPANDPFIITVGATDEKGTTKRTDDAVASFSAFGTTLDGYNKPEIYAPGRNIISVLSAASTWKFAYPDRVVLNGEYFRLSGTSMAAPMVTGAVALLLQDEPNLTPDQVKYRLINTASALGEVKYLDVHAAVAGTTMQNANTGLMPSQLLSTGSDPVAWGSVGWNSVGWNSVGWNSVGWNSVGWNSVGWNSVGWNSSYWGP